MKLQLTSIALGISIALVGASVAEVDAQVVDSAESLTENGQSGDNNSDLFSNGQVNSLHDLIHRAQLGQLQEMSEFNRAQQDSINSQAVDFRTRQLQLLQQAQPTPSGAIVPPEAVEAQP